MTRKHANRDWDDGSTVADMHVDGMQGDPPLLPGMAPRLPWYGRRFKSPGRIVPDATITRRETWKLIVNALGATLLIAAVFGAAAFLFILFCLKVWLK
jgi:hypothetical protein